LRIGEPTRLAAAFLLPLEVKKKTAGKNSQPFEEAAATELGSAATSQQSYFSSALQPFKPKD
jgi:hypothetical protein